MLPLWKLDPKSFPGPLRKVLQKELHLWALGWAKDRAMKRARAQPTATRHLLFAICDHYEPLHHNASMEVGRDRVRAWRTEYPKMAANFRDASGRPPRHSFFFPGEQYDPSLVEPLGQLTELGFGEVEVHLHHDRDTRATLTDALTKSLADLDRHGVVPKTKDGKAQWAFIHGNWCLANARRDGRWCGVDDEIPLLYDLGCYADFTFPSAPDQCQPAIVNSIYYPAGDPSRRRAYEFAETIRVGSPKRDRLMLIQGPIALALRQGSKSLRIESAALDKSDPPSPSRLRTWVDQGVSVEGRPEWVFVKVHTHGAPEGNAEVMLGQPIKQLHEALREYNDGTRWNLHYVTAREMYNVARAAMDGLTGSPASYFDYEIAPPARSNRK